MKRNCYQSTPESKGRQRRNADLLPFGVEDGAAPSYDNDKANGDICSASRKDERKNQSANLYAAMQISSAKS